MFPAQTEDKFHRDVVSIPLGTETARGRAHHVPKTGLELAEADPWPKIPDGAAMPASGCMFDLAVDSESESDSDSGLGNDEHGSASDDDAADESEVESPDDDSAASIDDAFVLLARPLPLPLPLRGARPEFGRCTIP